MFGNLMAIYHIMLQFIQYHSRFVMQSSRMDFMLRLPNCTDKHQMLIILTNPTSDI